MNINKEIGMRIKNARENKGFSTRNLLANEMGVHDNLIYIWETGKSLPSSNYIIKLAHALDVTPNDILGFGVGDTAQTPLDCKINHETAIELMRRGLSFFTLNISDVIMEQENPVQEMKMLWSGISSSISDEVYQSVFNPSTEGES